MLIDEKFGIHPLLRCHSQPTQNFKVWESQHGWILLETSHVSCERRKQGGIKRCSHDSPPSLLSLPPWMATTGTITGKEVKGIPRQGKGNPQQLNTPPTRMWDPMWVAVTMGRHAVRYGVKV